MIFCVVFIVFLATHYVNMVLFLYHLKSGGPDEQSGLLCNYT